MATITTHLGQNINWVAAKNAHNQFTITFTNAGSAFDISTYAFVVNIRKNGHSDNALQLTEASGITNGGATGILTIQLTQTQATTTLPGDNYFYEIAYTKDSKVYALLQGGLTLSAQTNPSSTTTSVSVSVSLAGTALTAAVTLAGGSGASTAEDVSFDPAGSIVADNVQDAIEELDGETIKSGGTTTMTDDVSIEGDGNTFTVITTPGNVADSSFISAGPTSAGIANRNANNDLSRVAFTSLSGVFNWYDPAQPGNAIQLEASNQGAIFTNDVTADGLKYGADYSAGYEDLSVPAWLHVKNYADGKVLQTITDGVTTSAPSQDAVADALALKASTASLTSHTGNTSNPHSVTKSQVGLGNADNTSDANKPVSTLQQAALDLKAPLASPALTGTPTAPTAAAGTSTTQVATTAFVRTEVVGTQDIYIPASAMWPRVTNGCAALARTELATSILNIQTLDFDQTTQEFAQFAISLPRNWNRGTVTANIYWTAAAGSATETVQWGISGGAYSNDDALTVALGTAQTSDDALIATNDLHVSPVTNNITLAGSPADSDFLAFQISRNPGSDTLAADAKLLGVVIHLTTDSGVAS